MVDRLAATPGLHSLLATFSGDQAHYFLRALSQVPHASSLRVFASPMLLDESLPRLFGELSIPFALEGHVAWTPDLPSPENRAFVERCRRPTHAAVLGWDTGLLLTSGDIRGRVLGGAKGPLHLDPGTHYVLSPSYHVRADAGFRLEASGPLAAVDYHWAEMLRHRPASLNTGWINTYLCS
jgi:hypothetical protein